MWWLWGSLIGIGAVGIFVLIWNGVSCAWPWEDWKDWQDRREWERIPRYRIVETYNCDTLVYQGERASKKINRWESCTERYSTSEEAQEAIEKYREKRRREQHHKVVGVIHANA